MKAQLDLRRTATICTALALAAVLGAAAVFAQDPAAATAPNQQAPTTGPAAQDPGWPRLYEAEGHEVVIHQPQIDSWDDYRMVRIRAALVIRKAGADQSEYGAVQATAPTSVDLESRTVLIGPRQVEKLDFPGAKPEERERLKKVVLAALPDEQPLTISLDRVLAYVAQSQQQKPREVQVNLDPPPIYASETPAILMIFAGKPRFRQVPGTNLMFAANTNWDLLLDPASAQYYLLDGDHWLSAKDPLQGPWAPAGALPADFSKLPDDENWKDVRQNLPGQQVPAAPTVFASTVPAELIVTDGPPQFEPIPGTQFMLVANTDSTLFMHLPQQQYYLLTAGRWFRAKALQGPWSAATRDLPADFAKIPEDHEAAAVLASVPGTPQAQEAVIQASIPRQVTVQRDQVTVNITYDGQPKFIPIEQTTVQYAANTAYSVFLVEGKYYCCYQGIWFVSSQATGPWSVCDSVPAAIYTIPPSHPMYNVTYVYVYDSTPDTVVVGSTGGYEGQYVAAGLVMFGAGVITGAILADDDDDEYWWGYHYGPAYFSYGCGAAYYPAYGGYYRSYHASYGPYGGAGAWGAYNPATGGYARGAYRYGPAGSASMRAGYNPWTDTYGARANVSTPYGSWGRSVASRGDDWVKTGHRTGPGGAAVGITGSEGAGLVTGKTRYGEGTAIARDRDGDLYVGHDGDIYRRDDDGNWQQRQDGQWTQPEGNPRAPRAEPYRQRTTPPDRAAERGPYGDVGAPDRAARVEPYGDRAVPDRSRQASARTPGTYQDLNSQAMARDRGNYSTQRISAQRSSGMSSPGRSYGGGGGGRSFGGGGGGRRGR